MNGKAKVVFKGVVGIAAGAAIGLAVSLISSYAGSGWAITCQPMVMVLLGAFVGLITAVGWGCPIQNRAVSLGWFWGPDSRFGSLPGVIVTRVDYAAPLRAAPTSDRILDIFAAACENLGRETRSTCSL